MGKMNVFRLDASSFVQLLQDPYLLELCPSLRLLEDDFDRLELALDAGLPLRRLRTNPAYLAFLRVVTSPRENAAVVSELIRYVQQRRNRTDEQIVLVTAQGDVLLEPGECNE